MFRRRGTATTQAPESRGDSADSRDGAVKTEGKGHPTPKRRDAQRRRQPTRAPQNRKEAYRRIKQRQRADRQRARAGIAAGDERYLPARDSGPVRKLARDYVDSRRGVGEYFLFLALAVVALSLVPVPAVQLFVTNIGFPLLLGLIIVEAVLLSRRLKRLAAERYPQESTKGLSFYAVTRSLQMRRLRMPPPAVKPGARV